jgi:NADH-quinone oxidoreductase subunit H
MRFGWRWLIPISLVWIVAVATFRVGNVEGWFSTRAFWIVAAVIFVVLLALSFFGGPEEKAAEADKAGGEFDAFAGGYPVPPMPGQQLPELAGVVTATAEDATTSDPADKPEGAQT